MTAEARFSSAWCEQMRKRCSSGEIVEMEDDHGWRLILNPVYRNQNDKKNKCAYQVCEDWPSLFVIDEENGVWASPAGIILWWGVNIAYNLCRPSHPSRAEIKLHAVVAWDLKTIINAARTRVSEHVLLAMADTMDRTAAARQVGQLALLHLDAKHREITK